MIAWGSEQYVGGGLALFADDADRRRWHYLSLVPQAAEITLRIWRSFSGTKVRGGGLLHVETNLGVDRRTREAAAAELVQRLGAAAPPPLDVVPVHFSSAEARLLFNAGGRLQSHTVVASSTPGNAAIFSVLLDEEGATLAEQALAPGGSALPIGVAYDVTFDVRQPAFDATLTIQSLREVYRSLRSWKLTLFGVSIGSSDLLDKLSHEQIVQLRMSDSMTGADRAALRRAAAQRLLQVAAPFLEPASPPPPLQQAESRGPLDFSVRNIDESTIDERRVVISLRERNAVRVHAYPNAQLTAIAAGTQPVVQHIELADDPFFSRRELTIAAAFDFAADSIARVDASADYGGERRWFQFTPGSAERQTADWPLVIDGSRAVEVKYEVAFRGDGRSQRWPRLRSRPATVEANFFAIAPRTLYLLDVVRFEADAGLPWWLFESVEVDVVSNDDADGITAAETFRLGPTMPVAEWAWFRTDATAAFSFRARFRVDAARTMQFPADGWASAAESYVAIADPLPLRHPVTVVFQRDGLTAADITVTCEEDGVVQSERFLFDATPKPPPQFVVRRRRGATGPLRLRYGGTLRGPDGQPIELPPSSSTGSVVTIGASAVANRIRE